MLLQPCDVESGSYDPFKNHEDGQKHKKVLISQYCFINM